MENLQHSLLISLIVILGVIMYLRLVRTLKNKRKSGSFSFIEGYDRVEGKHVITYTIGESEDSEMVLEDLDGKMIDSKPIVHDLTGTFDVIFNIPKIESEYVLLKWNTRNQKIVKKIYVDV